MHNENSTKTVTLNKVEKRTSRSVILPKISRTYRCTSDDLVFYESYFRSGQDFECLVLIIEELGISIYDRLKLYCPTKRMRVKDSCMIGIQLLDMIKNFHEKEYIHKNITP